MKKKPDTIEAVRVSTTHPDIKVEDLFKELEIAQRTQRPPSEELVAHLNDLALKPPFSYIHKVKKDFPL
jgi:hypothetical protein